MNSKMSKIVSGLLVGSVIVLGGCQGDERLSQVSTLQTEAQLEAENQNLAKKSKVMEEDLQKRHRFYQALKGKYEGSFQSEIGQINFRITFSPSLPPYSTDRVRQLEEVAADLNNLYLNVQVIQWNPSSSTSAVGCRVAQIRPDIMNGEIIIASESCSNLYRLKIGEANVAVEETTSHARQMSEWIASRQIEKVDAVIGEVQPSTNASIYSVIATRKD